MKKMDDFLRSIGKFLLKMKAMKPMDIARYAKDNTEFYKKLYLYNSLEDFSTLPLVKKEEIKKISPYDILSRPLARKVTRYGETTGSLGSPTPSFYTDREFKGIELLTYITPFRTLAKQILKDNRTCMQGLPYGFTIAGHSFSALMKKFGGLVAEIGSRSTIATPERIAYLITRIKPSFISGTPVDFLCWMKIIEEDYPEHYEDVISNLSVFLSTAELCAENRREAIGKRFGIFHINIYATVEGFFTLPCPCGENHIIEAYHTELYDDQENRVGLFGEGRLVFTNLIRKSTPFIRYLLDDYAKIYRSECPFGFTKSVIPYGRNEMNVILDGKKCNVWHFENIIFKHGIFGDYRVHIYEDKIIYELEVFDKEDITKDLSSLKNELDAEFKIPGELKMVAYGTHTDYRKPRFTKPILKVNDHREQSSQKVPEVL